MSSAEPPADAAVAEEEEAAVDPVDEQRQEQSARLQSALGDSFIESHVRNGDLWVRVNASAWKQAATACRDELGCDYFCFLSGLDWMPATAPNPEAEAGEVDVEGIEDEEAAVEAAQEAEEIVSSEAEDIGASLDGEEGWDTGFAGGETRFQVFARFLSTSGHYGVTIKADLDDEQPRVESIHTVYRGADWHERETWEMYGFDFVGHPHLAHIYLPGEFEGNPLRKDFPLLAREVKPWPGIVDVELFPPGVEEQAEAALLAKLGQEPSGGSEGGAST